LLGRFIPGALVFALLAGHAGGGPAPDRSWDNDQRDGDAFNDSGPEGC
jgi:hypothetical protein